MSRLTRIVPYAQRLLAEVLTAGDLAVDLTAGNGHDTLFLHRKVTAAGTVIAFDVDAAALIVTAERLQQAGAAVHRLDNPGASMPALTGVTLVADSHEHCARYLPPTVQGAIANLGYLPGSDRRSPTRTESTLAALGQVACRLAPAGRLCVVAYPGHAGGDEEAAAVERWFVSLPREHWDVLRIGVGNCPQAPLLLAAEKRPSP